MPASELKDLNLTVARFNMRGSDDPDSGQSAEQKRPELRAVRFEGNHLLDSVEACRLLTVENRPLVEIAFQAFLDVDDDSLAQFPVRVSTEADHVTVQTGLGDARPELSLGVHRLVVEAASSGLSTGLSDRERLERIVTKMKSRAESKDIPLVADIFE